MRLDTQWRFFPLCVVHADLFIVYVVAGLDWLIFLTTVTQVLSRPAAV